MTSDRLSNLWSVTSREAVQAPPLNGDIDVDLAIVGGGFTGCSAALEAARKGSSVALLEGAAIAFGGSGRNVGLVNAGLWLTPETVLGQLGGGDGKRLLEALSVAPARVFEIIAREGIDCDATRNGTLHLAHSPVGMKELRDRYRQGKAIGAPLQLLDAAETTRRTGSGKFFGALLDPRAGTLQPLAYCTGLARAAQAAGAHIHSQSAVTAIIRKGGHWEVSANGHTVRAGALLVATNAYHSGVAAFGDRRCHFVHYSQFATKPLPDDLRARILPGGEGCWDTALVMSSYRLDGAGRLIVGGMGDASGPGGAIHGSWARRKLRQTFPEVVDIGFEHVWEGRIAMTSDHIPKVVEIGPCAYAVFGYSGRGIAPGTIFGTAAAQALLEDWPDAFPIRVSSGYSERFTKARSLYYEFGATLTHATRPAPFC